MNRRHVAWCLAGSTLRFGLLIGLHLKVPLNQLPNPEVREHRNRIWATAQLLDGGWSAMLGQPVDFKDEDSNTTLPCSDTSHLTAEGAAEDFADGDYHAASLQVANIGSRIAASLYRGRNQHDGFSSRVQQALRDLSNWVQNLPDHLRAVMEDATTDTPMPIITLFLYLQQVRVEL